MKRFQCYTLLSKWHKRDNTTQHNTGQDKHNKQQNKYQTVAISSSQRSFGHLSIHLLIFAGMMADSTTTQAETRNPLVITPFWFNPSLGVLQSHSRTKTEQLGFRNAVLTRNNVLFAGKIFDLKICCELDEYSELLLTMQHAWIKVWSQRKAANHNATSSGAGVWLINFKSLRVLNISVGVLILRKLWRYEGIGNKGRVLCVLRGICGSWKTR